MATINSKQLFTFTSPRTPDKMIPEISLLAANLTGKEWDSDTQKAFTQMLREADFYEGSGRKDPAFSARDRINRAPKALGFVRLKPTVSLTEAGKRYVTSRLRDEVILRQLLKFQFPSPFHKKGKGATDFNIRPYLEILRLVRSLGSLSFEELMIFGLQLTNWHLFDNIMKKILSFREEKAHSSENHKKFVKKRHLAELAITYADEIKAGKIKTRESKEKSPEKFLSTKASNARDYADAFVRYLRATGMVSVSAIGRTLTVHPDRVKEVDFILETIGRDAVYVDDNAKYQDYMADASLPRLLTDNQSELAARIREEFPDTEIDGIDDIGALKEKLASLLEARRDKMVSSQIERIKSHELYDNIQSVFERIVKNETYDAPLMLEWNTWRAMTMIDGGDIRPNLIFDDYGNPLSTALGNRPDIICDYGSFMLNVEVTLQSGFRQFESENESVLRHLGKTKRDTQKPCYALFVAPRINESSIAHFYGFYRIPIEFYGGECTVVPLPLSHFRKMLERSHQRDFCPDPDNIKGFFEKSKEIALSSSSPETWYEAILAQAERWPGPQ